MMTRSGLIFVLSIFSIVCAAAQSGIGLGPQLGVYKSPDADGVRLMGGAAMRLKLSEAFGIEGSINYRQEEYAGGVVKVKSWPVTLTGLVYPIPVVYGAIGAGWYNTTIEYNFPAGFLGGPALVAGETTQEFGWHFGGGAELPFVPFATLVGDLRYVFLNYDFENLPGSNGIDSNFYVITASLLFGL